MIFLCLLLTLTACSQLDNSPSSQAVQESLKEIVKGKPQGYDFLEDEEFMNKIEDFIKTISISYDIDPKHFVLGHLNEGSVPEIVFFREKNPNNINDEGYLEVYAYKEEGYSLLDKTSMNFDKTNYQLVIGKLAEDVNGIYLSNKVGSHSAITYGFILENNKLQNILNPKKINLISTNTDNEIKDINNNGILEFSISTPDPECLEGAPEENIKFWYRWDGKDSADLVDVERSINLMSREEKASDEEVLDRAKALLDNNNEKFINFLIEKQDSISRQDNTSLIEAYIEKLEKRIKSRERIIEKLISNYDLANNRDLLKDKYGLSLDLINDIEYLNRKKVLESEDQLKRTLIDNLRFGYKYQKNQDRYNIVVNYQLFFDNFKDNIQNEFRDYLRVKSHYLKAELDKMTIDELAEEIVLVENFKITYPYSSRISELKEYHDQYLESFFHLDEAQLTKEEEIKVASQSDNGLRKKYKDIKEKYSHAYLSDLISKYLEKK